MFADFHNSFSGLAHVYGIRELADDEPALRYSPLVTAIEKTLTYVSQSGHIELTQSGCFKRSFVNWAAAAFDWPGYSEKELFIVNKVLNEWDFPPLSQIHALLLHRKIGRHFRGMFWLTKTGLSLIGKPGRIFTEVIEGFLRLHNSNQSEPLSFTQREWMILLNILNLAAEEGISCKRAGELFFSGESTGGRFDTRSSDAYVAVLRPLCWIGFLQEHPPTDRRNWDESVFIKTPLWKAALRLQTDGMLRPATRH